MRLTYILLLVGYFTFAQYGNNGPVKAFPSAVGKGSTTAGGRNGLLYKVNTNDVFANYVYYAPGTNNNSKGYFEGGLAWATAIDSVGHIVFDVSGNFNIGIGTDDGSGRGGTRKWVSTISGFRSQEAYPSYLENKTFYGQSAPRGGVTLYGGSFRFYTTRNTIHDVVFRYIRSRPIYARDGEPPSVALSKSYDGRSPGDDAYTWSFLFQGGENMMLDHCSGSFTYDKIIGGGISDATDYLRNITVQNGLFADGATGMFFWSGDYQANIYDISVYKNLMWAVNRTPNFGSQGFIEVVNNYIGDAPSKLSVTYGSYDLNHINNYYSSPNNDAENRINGSMSIYTYGNYYVGSLNGNSVNYTGLENQETSDIWYVENSYTQPASSSYFVSEKFTGGISDSDIISALSVKNDFIGANEPDLGAYKYLDDNGEVQVYRDSFDENIINLAYNGINYNPKIAGNWVLPTIPANIRPPEYDTDNDGMSDNWEMLHFGNLSQSYEGDYDGDGYLNIEEYMNQVDGEINVVEVNQVQNTSRKERLRKAALRSFIFN